MDQRVHLYRGRWRRGDRVLNIRRPVEGPRSLTLETQPSLGQRLFTPVYRAHFFPALHEESEPREEVIGYEDISLLEEALQVLDALWEVTPTGRDPSRIESLTITHSPRYFSSPQAYEEARQIITMYARRNGVPASVREL